MVQVGGAEPRPLGVAELTSGPTAASFPLLGAIVRNLEAEQERWFLIAGGPATVDATAAQSRAELGQVTVSAAFAALAGDAAETALTAGSLRLMAVDGVAPPAPS